MGYRFFSAFLESRINTQLESDLDSGHYAESDLVSFRIPVSYLAYTHTSENFDRIDGTVEVNGVEYKYVKQRLRNDTLEILCLPNKSVMQLRADRNAFFARANDLAGNSAAQNSSHKPVVKYDGPDFFGQALAIFIPDILPVKGLPSPRFSDRLPATAGLVEERPPECVLA